MKIKVKTLSGELPRYETEGSAGMDIRAYIDEPVEILPGRRALIPTGLFMEIPAGFEVQIRARSGLAVKHGIGLTNGIGTIDSDYRGEIRVSLINWGDEAFIVRNGDRIAQISPLRNSSRGLGMKSPVGISARRPGTKIWYPEPSDNIQNKIRSAPYYNVEVVHMTDFQMLEQIQRMIKEMPRPRYENSLSAQCRDSGFSATNSQNLLLFRPSQCSLHVNALMRSGSFCFSSMKNTGML